ncbi:MAG: hypothetical protein IH908_03870 [Proteobacteria bacterium]|nr:hypothetical protein [Pseudomonadota bacterium]
MLSADQMEKDIVNNTYCCCTVPETAPPRSPFASFAHFLRWRRAGRMAIARAVGVRDNRETKQESIR